MTFAVRGASLSGAAREPASAIENSRDERSTEPGIEILESYIDGFGIWKETALSKSFGIGKKRKQRNRVSRHPSTRGPFFAQHPLSGVDIETRRQVVDLVADEAVKAFDDHLSALDDLSKVVSPPHLLSILSCLALMAEPRRAGEKAGKGISRNGEVQQGHVEFMQGLLLRYEWHDRVGGAPEHIQAAFDGLPGLFRAYAQMRVPKGVTTAFDGETEIERSAAEAVQELLRGHTAVVRNWGYFSEVKRIASEVFAVADQDFSAVYGLTLTQVVALFEQLVRSMEESVNDFRIRKHAVLRIREPGKMALELAKQFPSLLELGAYQERISAPGVTREEAVSLVAFALEGHLPTCYIFSAEMVAEQSSLAVPVAASFLKLLSLRPGALAGLLPKSLLLENPVWTQPLIELGEDIYFCALPQTLMSFVFPIVERLAQPHAPLRSKLQRARARYLEGATELLLRSAFPGCQVVRGYKWMESGEQYESDLALRYDATVLLVESKSGAVSWPALRGAPQRMVKQIQELIVAPSNQSARLASRLKEALGGQPGPVADFPISLEGVRAVTRLSVTLHDFATVQSIPFLLVRAGLVRSEQRLAPCMTIADLSVLVDILDRPYLRMHYLRRRAELLTTATTFGDELDSIGMYLDTGFNIGDAEIGQQQLTMVGYSARLDKYYIARDEGLAANKPKVRITPWIRSLCEQLMAKGIVGWYELAHVLLNMDFALQEEIERQIKSLKQWMKNGRPAKNGKHSIVLIPPQHRRVAAIFRVRELGDWRTAREAALEITDAAFEHEHVDACAVFAFRPDAKDLSYASVGLLFRSDREVEDRAHF